MSAACQKNSYLHEIEAEVIICEEVAVTTSTGSDSRYNVILSDTVLFPEGGGQPDDRGTINDIPVLRVVLTNQQVIHLTCAPLIVGSTVRVVVDWKRRFDHMQQHSAQHLITAVAEREFGYKTTSWSLGERVCRIEMGTKRISEDELTRLEELCNQYIIEGRRMYPTYYDGIDDPALTEVRGRDLPDGMNGPIRVMTIEGIDVNLCCGTHVSTLSHLQSIKLLSTEKGKKSSTNVLFHAGGRVLKALGTSLLIEKRLNECLKGSPNDFPDLVKKLQNSFKIANKNSTNLLREVVAYEAEKSSLELKVSGHKYFFHHRREGDGEYMNTLIQKLKCADDVVKFLSVGDERGVGSFLLQGPADIVASIISKIVEIVDGKGAGKNGRFQGKANNLSRKHKVEQLIRETVS